jgi:hypothetical protein
VNEHLMTAVLYAAVFFETSSDAECDADSAVKQLEHIAYLVRQLSRAEQDEFRRHGYRLAGEHLDPADTDRVRAVVDALLG